MRATDSAENPSSCSKISSSRISDGIPLITTTTPSPMGVADSTPSCFVITGENRWKPGTRLDRRRALLRFFSNLTRTIFQQFNPEPEKMSVASKDGHGWEKIPSPANLLRPEY
ncbi:hypothetical protein QE152_g35311 [Popillia japonica]|uniref:Uncharacterized protein n=1 Tax=Popillia japonica TaxID=7064 RepID=A0AAW1IFM6_POPJA